VQQSANVSTRLWRDTGNVATLLPYRRPAESDAAPLFERSREKLRIALYATLGLIDVAAMLCVHLLFGHGVDRFITLEILVYGLLALKMQSWDIVALRRPREGAMRAAMAVAAAPVILFVLARLLEGQDILPHPLGRETLTLVVCLYFARFAVGELIGWLAGRRFSNELILVDGKPSLDFAGRFVVSAEEVGIAPHADPAMLNRIGHLLENCDRVVIDTPIERRAGWLEALRGIDVDVEFTAAEFGEYRPFELRTIEGNFTLLMRRGALRPWYRAQKRAFDIAVAGLALVLLAPVLLGLALAIRLDSPGPVLFRQRRVGRGNRHFTILKFRTMHHGQVDAIGARSTSRQDERVTRLGGVMRRTSLDELPQLLNVLIGDMSIVGPRPHALGSRAGQKLFWDVAADYWERHAIKPGMTGLAQIRGFRGATDTHQDISQRVRSDIEYLANWSLMGDVFILLRTVQVLIHDKAY
jgi:exopolysaccharide biosynthesis polyprenyl glycosylphosphotransferase